MLTNELYFVLPGVIMAFLIASLLVPVLNTISNKIRDFKGDLSEEKHSVNRTAGGLAVIVAVILSFQLWSVNDIHTFHPFFFASLALFMLSGYVAGKNIAASLTRIGIQFSASLVLIVGVSSEVGGYISLMGVESFPMYFSILFLSAILTLISSLFRYMGRLPELAGGMAIIITSVLGIWFWAAGFFNMALFSFIVSSSFIGYMMCSTNLKSVELGKFGWSSIGFVIAFLMMEFLLANALVAGEGIHLLNGGGLVLSLLIVPIVVWAADLVISKDLFTKGVRSEYYLVKLYRKLGMDKSQTSFLFWMINLIVIGMAYSTMHFNAVIQSIILIAFGVLFTTATYRAVLFTRTIPRKLSKLEAHWVKNWIKD